MTKELSLINSEIKGKRLEIKPKSKGYQIHFDHPNGQLFQGDAIDWLDSLESESIDLIFADPPYNIKKAEWDNFETQEKYIEWSMQWIEQAARVLSANGTIYICGFSEILADIKHPAMKLFKSCRWIVWHYKNKANLGNDWGRSHESLLHFRKTEKVTLIATNKENFSTIESFIEFSKHYLEFAVESLQAVIVSQNENHYRFYQYKQEGNFNITRPLNSLLMYSACDRDKISEDFLEILGEIRDIPESDFERRSVIIRAIYTMQQCIGAAFDALPAGESNKARKIKRSSKENLIRRMGSEKNLTIL